MADDLYVKTLEHEQERLNRIISTIGDLVDEGIYTTSLRSAHNILKKIGESIGLNMADLDDRYEDLDDSYDGDYYDDILDEKEDLYD